MVGAVVNGGFHILPLAVAKHERIAVVGVEESGICQAVGGETGGPDSLCAGLNGCRHMCHDVIEGIALDGLVIIRDIYSAKTCGASSGAVWPALGVEHEVPDYGSAAPAVHGAEGDLLHIVDETLFEVGAIVPVAGG